MPRSLDQFSQDLRLKLANVQSNLDGLKAKIDGKAENAEQDVRKHLDSVRKRIDQAAPGVAKAEAEVKTWFEEKKAVTNEKVAEWKTRRETAKLQNRADRAELYASAALDISLAAVDEAERATLEAWLARQDANAAVSK